ncbi:MAG: membrane protein insertion efficiency factor YidD [Myxococcales bacterium]|nr:membrane protein insertion efficiency factor YidD [Myxococcales bacterium]
MTTRPTPWLGRGALEAAIELYRRRLSGRGPLRRVTCTFGRCESCSAYGLRMVREHARSLPHALRLIFGRIRRCRSSSVYRHDRALVWGEDYDHLDRIDEIAVQAHERPSTRGALLRAAVGLARYRGEHRAFCALIQRLRGLPSSTERAAVPLRDGRRLHAHLRGRWRRALAYSLLLGALALVTPLPLTVLLGLLGLAMVVASTRRYLAERQRLDRQLRLARFALA